MIGFHVGPGGRPDGIGEYVQTLDAVGIPACIVSADVTTGISDALALIASGSQVPHVLVFRVVRDGSEQYAVPDYSLSPADAARDYYGRIEPHIASEVKNAREHVYIAIGNELDRSKADWIGHWLTETAALMNADGYRVVGPNWSTGTPEYDHWQTSGILRYLRYCANHSGRAAVGVHEYSLDAGDLHNGFPYLLGRFRFVHEACDEHGIPRPDIVVTEFGWAYNDIPNSQGAAVEQLVWAYHLYREAGIKGAAIWYLGGGWDNIAIKVQPLIDQVAQMLIEDPPPPDSGGCRGVPRTQYPRTYQLVHPTMTDIEAVEVFRLGLANKRTTGGSFDDGGIGDLDERTVVVYGCPAGEVSAVRDWYGNHYPGVAVEFERVRAGESVGTLPARSRAQDNIASDCRGAPRVQYPRVYQVLHPSVTNEQAVAIFRQGWEAARRTTGWSFDDAGIGDLDERTVEIFGCPAEEEQAFLDWYAEHYPGVEVVFAAGQGDGGGDDIEVTPLSQRDPRWADEVLGQDTGHGKTVGNWGCLLTVYTVQANALGLCDDEPAEMNQRMVAAGAFSAQYIRPGALATAFPEQIENRGYLSRDDSEMIPRIVDYLNRGLPVPARVDFVPATSPREQHWVLLIGHRPDDFVMADPWTGEIGLLSEVYSITGDDVLEALFYVPTEVPPPAGGNALLGLHATADTQMAPGELTAFHTAEIKLIKVLSNLHPEDVSALATTLPDAKWIVRAFLDFGRRAISPAQFVNDTLSDVQRTLARIGPGRDVVVELHNEPNLVQEGLGAAWANGAEFNDWFLQVLTAYRDALPGIDFIYPGLSPGHAIPGMRAYFLDFLQESLEAAQAADGVGIHAYWSVDYHMSIAINNVYLIANMVPEQPLWITEASNNKGGVSPQEKGQEYITFWREMRQRVQRVQGVTYFVASASNPDFAEEVWVAAGESRGIAEVVGQR